MPLRLSSPAFSYGESIPTRFTCDGNDISPPLSWNEVPSDTKSVAIICDDPDAPSEVFVHWVLYNLKPAITELSEAISVAETLQNGAKQGKNGFNRLGYGGPCPPVNGAHRYFFRLHALDSEIEIETRAGKDELVRAMEGHILEVAVLMGTYQRKKSGSK